MTDHNQAPLLDADPIDRDPIVMDPSRGGTLAVYAMAGLTAFSSGEAVLGFAAIDRAAAAAHAASKVGRILTPGEAQVSPSLSTSIPFNVLSNEAVASLTPDEQQQCIDDGMNPSQIVAAKMRGVHKQHGAGWSGRVRMRTDAMPDFCADADIYRLLNVGVLMQDGKHRARQLNILPFSGDNDGKGLAFNGSAAGGGPTFYNINYVHDHSFHKFDYICSPGAKKTAVHVRQMNTVVHIDDHLDPAGNIVGGYEILAGSRITLSPVKVYGAC